MEESVEKSPPAGKFEVWRPRLLFLLLGLILGPLISEWLGLQVTVAELTGTTSSAVEEAIVGYRARLCVERARSDPEATSAALADEESRRKLAEKWSVLPGEVLDLDVINQCSARLAKP